MVRHASVRTKNDRCQFRDIRWDLIGCDPEGARPRGALVGVLLQEGHELILVARDLLHRPAVQARLPPGLRGVAPLLDGGDVLAVLADRRREGAARTRDRFREHLPLWG